MYIPYSEKNNLKISIKVKTKQKQHDNFKDCDSFKAKY